MVLVRQRAHREVVWEGASPLERGDGMGVRRRHQVTRVENHRGPVTMVENLAIRTNRGRGHHVWMAPEVTIEHGAGGTPGAGLLHPVRDIQEVGEVVRVGGVVRGPGQGACLVAVGCAASALSVLVVSAKHFHYISTQTNPLHFVFKFLEPTHRLKKERTQFVRCLSVFGVYLCCLSSQKCLSSAD